MGMLPASNAKNTSSSFSSNNTVSSSETPLNSYINTLSLQQTTENTSSELLYDEVNNITSPTPTSPKAQDALTNYLRHILPFKIDARSLKQTSKNQNNEVNQILDATYYPKILPDNIKLIDCDMQKEAKEAVPSTQRVVNDAGQWNTKFVIHCLEKTKSNKGYTENKRNVLFYAAELGNMALLNLLKQHKLINTEDARTMGNYALREASANGHVEVLRFLKDEFGLTTDDARANNNQALRKAAENGHMEVVEFFENEWELTLS